MEITAEGEQLISQLKGYFDIYADDNRLSEGIKLVQLRKFMLFLVMLMMVKFLKRMMGRCSEDEIT